MPQLSDAEIQAFEDRITAGMLAISDAIDRMNFTSGDEFLLLIRSISLKLAGLHPSARDIMRPQVHHMIDRSYEFYIRAILASCEPCGRA